MLDPWPSSRCRLTTLLLPPSHEVRRGHGAARGHIPPIEAPPPPHVVPHRRGTSHWRFPHRTARHGAREGERAQDARGCGRPRIVEASRLREASGGGRLPESGAGAGPGWRVRRGGCGEAGAPAKLARTRACLTGPPPAPASPRPSPASPRWGSIGQGCEYGKEGRRGPRGPPLIQGTGPSWWRVADLARGGQAGLVQLARRGSTAPSSAVLCCCKLDSSTIRFGEPFNSSAASLTALLFEAQHSRVD